MEGTIKQRICNHKLSFTNRNYSSNTSLSSYIWYIKDTNNSPTITWEILKQAPAYNRTSKKCLLCLHQKLAIITNPSQNTLLNKKSETLSKCSMRTNTFFHTSTHVHNPSNTSNIEKKRKKTHPPNPTWSTVSTIFLHQPSQPPQYMYHLSLLTSIPFSIHIHYLLNLHFYEH